MHSTPPLAGSHLRTHNRIFQHPASHNLEWHDIRALLDHLGDVEIEANGNLKATRNGHTLVLRPSQTKDVAQIEDLISLRHFLQQSEPLGVVETETHWLLVIDHHEARIFRSELHGTVPRRILPHEPDRYFRHAPKSRQFARGEDKPDPNSFFEPIAQTFRAAGKILVFGAGTGKGSEMEQFMAWLRHTYPDVYKRVIGSVVIDEHRLTENQLLAKAKEFYASPPTS